MEHLVKELRHLVKGAIRDSETALEIPHVQSRTPLATLTRDCLIRQLWHGDRVLALLRDGQDYFDEFDLMMLAGLALRQRGWPSWAPSILACDPVYAAAVSSATVQFASVI